mgnify:CR=1 FL=1
MAEPKAFCTYEEQLEILRKRGLTIPDESLALRWLKEKNYYRLSAYSLTLRERDTHTREDRFFDGASFTEIVELYAFDDQLRSAIFHAASIVETNLKSYIAHYHTQHYGPIGYMDGANFEDRWRHARLITALSKSLNLRKDEPFVLHHHNDLNDVYPLWVIAEVLSFDQVSMMYRNLLPNDRSAIAREYYGISSREYIENWTHCAVVARNISAHGARFYHRQRVNPPAKLPKSINQYGTKPFGYVYAIHHLLPPSERALFVDSVQSCFDSHPSAKLSELGFPVNWKEILSEY